MGFWLAKHALVTLLAERGKERGGLCTQVLMYRGKPAQSITLAAPPGDTGVSGVKGSLKQSHLLRVR